MRQGSVSCTFGSGAPGYGFRAIVVLLDALRRR
jgi:hypothetical protein